MSSNQDGPLDELRWHWGDAYLICYLGGRWVAQGRDSHETISADGPQALLDLIRRDYGQRPVSRAVTPGTGDRGYLAAGSCSRADERAAPGRSLLR